MSGDRVLPPGLVLKPLDTSPPAPTSGTDDRPAQVVAALQEICLKALAPAPARARAAQPGPRWARSSPTSPGTGGRRRPDLRMPATAEPRGSQAAFRCSMTS